MVSQLLPMMFLALWVLTIADASFANAERTRKLPKSGWLMLIVCLPVLGSIGWAWLGRPRGGLRRSDNDIQRPRPFKGPEDDPAWVVTTKPSLPLGVGQQD